MPTECPTSHRKILKALLIEKGKSFNRTHSIRELVCQLRKDKLYIDIHDDECDFLDVIYIPSKYPVYTVLPNAVPSKAICVEKIKIAERVFRFVEAELS